MPSFIRSTSKTLKSFLAPLEEEMVEKVTQFCEINSGSLHLQGIAHMHDALKAAFKPLVNDIETHALPPVETINMSGQKKHTTVGPVLFLRKRPHLKRRILLSGHMDTVFGENSAFQQVTQVKPGILQGPGVTDMKGGLVIILYALKAFETLDIASSIGWDVCITADEELGAPGSHAFLEAIRDDYRAGLVYESSITPKGMFARARKGSGKFTWVAHGKAAHAGRSFKKGRNAITYLAEVLVAINALNQNKRNTTLNVGEIKGGEALNIVADLAVAKIDVRTSHPEDAAWTLKQFKYIQTKFKRRGYNLELYGSFGRPVKVMNQQSLALFKRLRKLGALDHQWFSWKDTGGCCDGNNLAENGLAVVDSLGARGGNIHSIDEYLIIDSLVERAHLSALLLADLANGGLEALTSET